MYPAGYTYVIFNGKHYIMKYSLHEKRKEFFV